MKRKDYSPAAIHRALTERHYDYADVDGEFNLKPGTARGAARFPHEAGELAIAEVLGELPQKIWPSRYDGETGVRLIPQPFGNYIGV